MSGYGRPPPYAMPPTPPRYTGPYVRTGFGPWRAPHVSFTQGSNNVQSLARPRTTAAQNIRRAFRNAEIARVRSVPRQRRVIRRAGYQPRSSARPSARRSRANRRSTRRTRRRTARRRRPAYNLQGYSKINENGGVVSNVHSLYLGHSVAAIEMGRAIAGAIIRELFRQKGEIITRFSDLQNTSVTTESLVWSYYTSETATAVAALRSIALSSANSYETLANALFTDWVTVFAAGQLPILHQTYIATQTGNITSAMINMQHTIAEYNFTSVLKVQNCSLGGVSNAADADDDVDESITRNPLIGKLFGSNKRLNGFRLVNRPTSADASYRPLIAHNTTGFISALGSTMVSPDLVKVPTKHAFGASTQSSVRLDPGEIKVLKIKKMHKIRLSTLWQRFGNGLDVAGGVDGATINLGSAQMIGLEKLLDSKTFENTITCHYEIVQKHQCKLKKRSTFCATLVSAATTS